MCHSVPAYSLLVRSIVDIYAISSGIIAGEWEPRTLTYPPKHCSQVNILWARYERIFASGSTSSLVQISGRSSSISTNSLDLILLASLGGTGGSPSPMYTPSPVSVWSSTAFARTDAVAGSCPLARRPLSR